MLALFRIIEPSGGAIVIDGLDTATMGLTDLRSRYAAAYLSRAVCVHKLFIYVRSALALRHHPVHGRSFRHACGINHLQVAN